MGAHFFDQDDYLTIYLTPDTAEVVQGGELAVTYTLINRWGHSEPFTGLTQVILPNGNPYDLIGPVTRTIPASTTFRRLFRHTVPALAPIGEYEYWTTIESPLTALYDEDRFTFVVTD